MGRTTYSAIASAVLALLTGGAAISAPSLNDDELAKAARWFADNPHEYVQLGLAVDREDDAEAARIISQAGLTQVAQVRQSPRMVRPNTGITPRTTIAPRAKITPRPGIRPGIRVAPRPFRIPNVRCW